MYSINVGDLGPAMIITLASNEEPDGANLAGATDIKLDWLKPDGTQELVDLVAVDLTIGKVSRTWVAGDTDIAGIHIGRVKLVRGGAPMTFPSDGSSIRWQFNAALGPC